MFIHATLKSCLTVMTSGTLVNGEPDARLKFAVTTSLNCANPAFWETTVAATHGTPSYDRKNIETVPGSSCGFTTFGSPDQSTSNTSTKVMSNCADCAMACRCAASTPEKMSGSHFTSRTSSPRHARYGMFVSSGSGAESASAGAAKNADAASATSATSPSFNRVTGPLLDGAESAD